MFIKQAGVQGRGAPERRAAARSARAPRSAARSAAQCGIAAARSGGAPHRRSPPYAVTARKARRASQVEPVNCLSSNRSSSRASARPAPSPSALYYRPPAVFHRPPCFVFHYFQRPCVSLCFVFQNLGGAVKARVSCFVFQIFRACSAPAARLASGGACGGLSPLRDENLLRAAWISPTRGNGRNFRRKPVLPRPHMYVWPPARVGQAGLYLQTALKVVDS